MSGLYPIIRRMRRPLIIVDDDAGPPPAVGAVVPLVGAEKAVSYGKGAPRQKGKHAAAENTERRG